MTILKMVDTPQKGSKWLTLLKMVVSFWHSQFFNIWWHKVSNLE